MSPNLGEEIMVRKRLFILVPAAFFALCTLLTAPAYALVQLHVFSESASSVPITSDPTGYDGTTDYFIYDIPDGAVVELTAPLIWNGLIFRGWNGCIGLSGIRNSTCKLILDYNWSVRVDYSAPVPSDDFVTTWRTYTSGISGSTSIIVPMVGGPYDVDWNNDGTFDQSGLSGAITHDFGSIGTYTIRIRGVFDSIRFANAGDKTKLLRVDQWGSNGWTSMEDAFYGVSNLTITASDVPDFSSVTDMSHFFAEATNANPDTTGWDVSSVTDMEKMFLRATSANPDTSTWDTSSVTNMSSMFGGATSAVPDTSRWNISSVLNMNGMFADASSANPDTSNWDTSSVTDMSSMFEGATSANPDTSNWDTSSVTNMSSMFEGATSANPDTSSWDTSSVTTVYYMFFGATVANPNTSNWNTSSISDMRGMFNQATAANPDTSGWNTSSVLYMSEMFRGASIADPDTSSWDTSAVTHMHYMFSKAPAADPDTSAWDTSSVEYMDYMFNDATSANPDTSNWNTASVLNMSGMFRNATSANPDTSNWDTSSVTEMSGMFSRASSADPDTSNWDTSSVSTMAVMFHQNTAANPDTSNWDTSSVLQMGAMFMGATAANPDTSGWDTSNVQSMSSMFENATSFDRDIGSWNVTSLLNATDMFLGTALSTPNYESLLIGWNAQTVQPDVPFHGGNSTFCSDAALAAWENLMTVHGWTIADGGQDCPTCNLITVSETVDSGVSPHDACERLVIGPSYLAEDGADVTLSAGESILLIPELYIGKGAIVSVKVCGQSLCTPSLEPMPYGCHSCVDRICDEADSGCCNIAFDQACVDKVESVCDLICE